MFNSVELYVHITISSYENKNSIQCLESWIIQAIEINILIFL